MKRGKPHAPQAPGPRPGTWHKQQRHSFVGYGGNPPPIYTRPTPKKQKLNDRSFHPGKLRKIGGR